MTAGSLAVPSSPDCIPTPISSSANTDDDGSSYLSAADAATSSPRPTTDTFATPSHSPQLPLSPPHSLPASRRSSLAFDAHGTMLSTSVTTATSSPRGPGSSRSRSSTPGRQPRPVVTSPEESPKPYSQLGHVFESLNRQFGHQMRMQSASGTRSPRQGSGHSSRAASTAPTSPVLVTSPGLLEHKASFEHALQAKLGVEASVRPSRSTTSRAFLLPLPSTFVASSAPHASMCLEFVLTRPRSPDPRSLESARFAVVVARLVSPSLARPRPPSVHRFAVHDTAPFIAALPSRTHFRHVGRRARCRRLTVNLSLPHGRRPLRVRHRLDPPSHTRQDPLHYPSNHAWRLRPHRTGALGPPPRVAQLECPALPLTVLVILSCPFPPPHPHP